MEDRAVAFRELAHDRFGIDPAVVELPEGTHTAADAAAAVGVSLAQIAKSMVMRAGDDLVLVLTSGSNRVDEEALATVLGVDAVEPASPDAVKAALGWSIGGVPPFGHETEVRTFIDPTLLEHEEVWAGAGTPHTVFPIDPRTLRELADAEATDAFEAG